MNKIFHFLITTFLIIIVAFIGLVNAEQSIAADMGGTVINKNVPQVAPVLEEKASSNIKASEVELLPCHIFDPLCTSGSENSSSLSEQDASVLEEKPASISSPNIKIPKEVELPLPLPCEFAIPPCTSRSENSSSLNLKPDFDCHLFNPPCTSTSENTNSISD
ncbi:hypothetical protein [Okeania sp.]|uniref:hypothetical protein n=1 Tax=Okeania sp. TaxID=3100323 RepID=UPI002B4ACC5E|nr:hypothetical protein [Okeania sp.]MEB3340880.1 hypothetical protein [Okeania sp.]